MLIEYTVSAEDVKGPFVEKIPAKMEQMKDLERLGYQARSRRSPKSFT